MKKFLEKIKNMNKKQKIIVISSSLVIILAIAIIIVACLRDNKANESKSVVSKSAATQSVKGKEQDEFDTMKGTIITDENIKNKIKDSYQILLKLYPYENSKIGPMPGLFIELGLITSDEINQFVLDTGIIDPSVYIKSNIKYEDFKNAMLKYMTEDYFNENFSNYKNMDGYVGFCNCAGGFIPLEIAECKEVKLIGNDYFCKMIIKDVQLYENFLNDPENSNQKYEDCFIARIIKFTNINDNFVVDTEREYKGTFDAPAMLLQTSEETSEEQLEAEKVGEETVRTGSATYYIRVNYGANTVTIYGKDGDGNYTVPVKAMICSCGISTPKSGVYRTSSGYRWGTLIGGVYGQYSTRIVGNILFHSVPYTAQSPDSLEYWEFDKLGTKASAGCVRLQVKDAQWIYYNCGSGTMVEFYSSDDPGPLGKPSAPIISGNERCRDWDPTDDAEGNPWRDEIQEEPPQEVVNPEPAPETPKEPEKPATTNTSNQPVQNKVENKPENTVNNTVTNTTQEPQDNPGEEPGDEPGGEEPGNEPGTGNDNPGEEPGNNPGEEPGQEPGEEPGGEEPGNEPAAGNDNPEEEPGE